MSRSRTAVLGTLWLLLICGLGPVVAPFYLPVPAVLRVEFIDGTFGADLAEEAVTLEVEAPKQFHRRQLSRLDHEQMGTWSRLASGPSRFHFEFEGYRPVNLNLGLQPLAVSQARIELESISGLANVTIVDATTGEPISQAKLTVPAEHAGEGPEHSFALPAGRHELWAEAAGYCKGEQSVQIQTGEELQVSLPLSPHLEPDEAARLVLDWAENPRDLDAHVFLEGAGAPVSKTHVFFLEKEGHTDSGQLYASLDVDHQNSEGFETVTLSSIQGTYRYFVHLYAGEGTLDLSEATVSVSTRGCKKKTYRVPADCHGRFWSVVDIKIADSVDILERGECSENPPRRWTGAKG